MLLIKENSVPCHGIKIQRKPRAGIVHTAHGCAQLECTLHPDVLRYNAHCTWICAGTMHIAPGCAQVQCTLHPYVRRYNAHCTRMCAGTMHIAPGCAQMNLNMPERRLYKYSSNEFPWLAAHHLSRVIKTANLAAGCASPNYLQNCHQITIGERQVVE